MELVLSFSSLHIQLLGNKQAIPQAQEGHRDLAAEVDLGYQSLHMLAHVIKLVSPD